MFVICDSNVYIQDFYVKSEVYRLFQRESEKCGIKLFVSSIVVDEVVQKFKEKLVDFNRLKKEYYMISEDYLKDIPSSSLDEMVQKYRDFLESSLFNFNFYSTRDINFRDCNFESVYYKSLHKLKPFNEKGKGFKDALIWEHVKWVTYTYADDLRKVAFITNNCSDFSDLRKETSDTSWYYPAKHLIDEYSKDGYLEDTIRIYPGLSSFCYDVIQGKQVVLDSLIQKLNTSLNEKLKEFIPISLREENKTIYVQSENYGEFNCYIKTVLNVKATSAFRAYGEGSSNEAIIMLSVDLLMEPVYAKLDNLVVSEELSLHMDIINEEFKYIEGFQYVNITQNVD